MSTAGQRPGIEELERVEVASVDELRTWLAEHHRQDDSIWLVTYKKSAGPAYVSRDEVLDELLCVGWIDGARRKLDDRRTMQLVGPRRTDRWAKTYRERATRLLEEGRMGPAGLAAIERSRAAGLWEVMAEVDALVWPPDLAEALAGDPAAEAFFRAAAPSYQRNVLRWIELARTEATRTSRVAETVRLSARGDKIRHL